MASGQQTTTTPSPFTASLTTPASHISPVTATKIRASIHQSTRCEGCVLCTVYRVCIVYCGPQKSAVQDGKLKKKADVCTWTPPLRRNRTGSSKRKPTCALGRRPCGETGREAQKESRRVHLNAALAGTQDGKLKKKADVCTWTPPLRGNSTRASYSALTRRAPRHHTHAFTYTTANDVLLKRHTAR